MKRTEHEAEAGFAIGIEPEHIIEDTARDKFEDVRHNSEFRKKTLAAGLMDRSGGITAKGWDLLNEDIQRIERNSMKWMRQKFRNARDEGHGGHGEELIGTFWFDPTDPEHAHLVEMAADTGKQERIDMVDLSYGDLANTAFDGVSDFGASVLSGSITFFDVKPEDMEAIETTLEQVRKQEKRISPRRPGARESRRSYSMTYGTLPPFEKFIEDIRRPDPDERDGEAYWPEGTTYPMELVDSHEVDLADEYGGLTPFESRYSHKAGFRGDERAIYGFLEFLANAWNEGDEAAGDLASSIMTTLGYEWI